MLVHLIDVTDMPSHNCPNTVTKQKKKWMKIWALFYHIRYAWWVSKQKIQMLIIIKCILLCRYVKTWMYTHHFFARYTIYDFCHPCLQYVIFWMARLVKSNKKKNTWSFNGFSVWISKSTFCFQHRSQLSLCKNFIIHSQRKKIQKIATLWKKKVLMNKAADSFRNTNQ